jgi:hypothetical protein
MKIIKAKVFRRTDVDGNCKFNNFIYAVKNVVYKLKIWKLIKVFRKKPTIYSL